MFRSSVKAPPTQVLPGVNTLVKLGATRAEVEEALGMAVYMGGGPSLMYAAEALGAFEELSVS